MAIYLGKSWSKHELLAYIGDPQQICGATASVLADGKSEGVKAVQVNTGGGLAFTVLPGRGMDIAGAWFRDRALGFLTGAGIVSPGYYEEPGLGWLRNFFAGLLTTCGITNSGAPSTDQGKSFGLHGRAANAGAEDLAVTQEWDGDEYVIQVKGRIREVLPLIGENMTLTRRIETRLGAKGFSLEDVVENRGFDEQPLMMLYHFNFGFPLLSPNSRIVGPVRKIEPRDEEARKDRGPEEALAFPEPVHGYHEKVFFLSLAADASGRTFIALLNRDLGDGTPLGIVLRFNRKELPTCTEWKMPGRGFYVLGLEPGTAVPLGRGRLRERGELPTLAGQSRYPVHIEFQVLDNIKEMEAVEQEAKDLAKR